MDKSSWSHPLVSDTDYSPLKLEKDKLPKLTSNLAQEKLKHMEGVTSDTQVSPLQSIFWAKDSSETLGGISISVSIYSMSS